jgi:hypothetical protein
MACRFDPMAVGIEDESGIVIRMVLRARAGSAVTTAARVQRGGMEVPDGLAAEGAQA